MMASAPAIPVHPQCNLRLQPAGKPDRPRAAFARCFGSKVPPRSRRRWRSTPMADFPGRCSRCCFFAPDLSMLAYFAGPRAGAAAYNVVHTYLPALALVLAGFFRPARGIACGSDLDRAYRLRSRARLRPQIFDRFRRHPSRPASAAAEIHTQQGEAPCASMQSRPAACRSNKRRSKAADTGCGGSCSRCSRANGRNGCPVYAWAIEHPEGVIVVDTGSGAHLKSLAALAPVFSDLPSASTSSPNRKSDRNCEASASARGDVKTVVLTHLHIDHDGGLAHFPDSRILADRDEIARTAGIAGAISGYLPSRWPKWFEPQPLAWQPSRFGPFARSARITEAGDVIAVPTPGHTPNHLSVIVRDGDAQIMLAGDASYLEATMLRGSDRRRQPGRDVGKDDARRHPALVRRAPDHLSADARSAAPRERLAQRRPVGASNATRAAITSPPRARLIGGAQFPYDFLHAAPEFSMSQPLVDLHSASPR